MAEQEVSTQEAKQVVTVHDDSEYAMLFDSDRFAQAWRVAKLFSSSKLVPTAFQGSPENCFIALHMAVRLELDPMAVMQKTYIIHGRPGMEAQLIIAMVNARGPFKGPIQWDVSGEGDNEQWTAYAYHKQTGERCEATVTMKMVKAEGWFGKEGSKWKTIPALMGRYRSATFLARLFCPEVIMGLSTVDELQDMEVVEAEITTLPQEPKVPQTEKVKEKLKRSRKTPETAPEDAPPEVATNTDTKGEDGVDTGTVGPRSITKETLSAIKDAMEATGLILNLPYGALKLSQDIALEELDEKTGLNVLAWYKSQ